MTALEGFFPAPPKISYPWTGNTKTSRKAKERYGWAQGLSAPSFFITPPEIVSEPIPGLQEKWRYPYFAFLKQILASSCFPIVSSISAISFHTSFRPGSISNACLKVVSASWYFPSSCNALPL